METVLNKKDKSGLVVSTYKSGKELVTSFQYMEFPEDGVRTFEMFHDFLKRVSHGVKRSTAANIESCHKLALEKYGDSMIAECEAHQASIKE